MSSQVRTMLWNGAPFEDGAPHALWSTAVIAAGYEAVADAYERAVFTDARHALQWRDTTSGSWPVESFADHGSVAVFRTNDPDAAWDLAVELGSAHQPVFGTELIATLTERLPSAVIEAGWATARRTLARTHARTRRAAAYATSTGTAVVVCQLAAAAAADAGRSDLLHHVTWEAVADLVEELTSRG